PIFLTFVVQCFPGLPTPPPFPTRRSSDLQRRRLVPRARGRVQGRQGATGRLQHARVLRPRPRVGQVVGPRAVRARQDGHLQRPRSEEHTSELQSREKLVCRLLLEKKKREQ